MREIRTSGSEGGGTGYSTGLPTPLSGKTRPARFYSDWEAQLDQRPAMPLIVQDLLWFDERLLEVYDEVERVIPKD
jgi:hypothetical protein